MKRGKMTAGDWRADKAHHVPGGGFRNPWPTAVTAEEGGVLRWQRERRQKTLPPSPSADQLPRALPQLRQPQASPGELRVTWGGHSSWLIQLGAFNILTDPHWSDRASPLRWMGPRRFSQPGIAFEDLPRIDLVLLSHDHYDHLDEPTVRKLRRKFGRSVHWLTPLAHATWFRKRNIDVAELDWWDSSEVKGDAGVLHARCLPAQHWGSRTPFDRFQKLWCSWAVEVDGRKVYFAGDSGYFPGYREIGTSSGPFDLVLMPIGAYEPRWFMRPHHMNPADAVEAYLDLGGAGLMGTMHWGTFRLTDEDPLEPPRKIREAWQDKGLEPKLLWVPAHGETRCL